MKLEELVNKYYDNLNQNDMYIWRYISANKKKCSNMTIEDMATSCNVSRTTILRFAQKLSLNGFSELKIYLKWETSDDKELDSGSVEFICDGYIRAIKSLEKKDFTSACKLMYEADRIFIYGTGDIQQKVAKQLKMIFFHGGICLYDFEGITLNDAFFNIASPKDLVIIISLSGETKNAIALAKRMKINGIKILSVTKLRENTLASLSTENLYITTSTVNISPQFAYLETTTIFYILSEILFVRYSHYKETRESENT